MPADYLRAIAICVIRNGDSIFVLEGFDSVKNSAFYRPLGGGIEFGEPGKLTVERELVEEIGEGLTNVRYLGTIESIFTHEGEQGHEIVLVYEGDFANSAMYSRSEVEGHEDSGETFRALWMPVEGFRGGEVLLVPEALLELL